jgi:hypothetical protein
MNQPKQISHAAENITFNPSANLDFSQASATIFVIQPVIKKKTIHKNNFSII